MRIRKILMYVIFAFIMVMPFSVNAEDVEYDVNFITNPINMSIDPDYLNKLKVIAYNSIISHSSYTSTHETIETYNEFYLNNGYFIALGTDGNYGVFVDIDCDYIKGFSKYIRFKSYPDDIFKFFIFYEYDYWVSINKSNVGTLKDYNQGTFSWIDKDINNYQFYQDWNSLSDLTQSDNLLTLMYPILGTNRAVKWQSGLPSGIFEFTDNYVGSSSDRYQDSTDINIESLNSSPGNIFRHPYSTEETDKVETNKQTTIFSINSNNYSNLKINYILSDDIIYDDWDWTCWTNPWSYGSCKDNFKKPGLSIEINSTSSISYPRRYTGYKVGNDIEFIKEPSDFGDSVLSKVYKANIASLGTGQNALSGYFDFDLRDLPENTIITITLEYDPNYIQFDSLPLPEIDMVEYDMTGKYAVGLVPKFTQSNNAFPLLYQGSFSTFYSFNNDTYNVKDAESISSSDVYSKKILSFINFSDNEIYEKPIFYIINNNSSNSEIITKIKYSSTHFELLEFDSLDSQATSIYSGFTYLGPSSNFISTNSNMNSTPNTGSNDPFSISNIFSSLPEFVIGLSGAFVSVGTCIFIVFSSFPPMIQGCLTFAFAISILALAIKMLRG